MVSNKENILAQAKEALNNRLNNSENYNRCEIADISKLDSKLFDHALDKETTEILRKLCASHSLTKTLKLTKSHRPVIGPLIYFVKKLLSKAITPFLKIQFDQIETFNINAVLAIAKLYNSKNKAD